VLALPDAGEGYDPLLTAERTGATFFPTVPAYLDALARMGEPPPRPDSLRLVITAGAPLAAATSARFREAFGLPVHVFYGSSECGGICYDREGTAAERGTVGEPVDGVRIALEPVGDPGDGEGVVTVLSPAVAAGYVPEPDARLSGGRFQAGDLAVWDGGELRLRGRVDGLINVKGKKVRPAEIEAVLQRLPGVEEAIALGVPSPDRASDLLRAVVACPTGSLTYEEVVTWCRRHLPDHKVPRSVVLVSAIPRTSRGKVDLGLLVSLAGGDAEP
jgi:long-chain acyl-CoA synthetase